MKTKIFSIILILSLVFAMFCGCGENANTSNGKLKVITTLFPQYDFTKQICGDEGEVSLLLSPGVDSHSFDPTPKDVSNILSCDIFIYTGDDMEPWVASILKTVDKNVTVLDLSKYCELMYEKHDHSEEDHNHTADPHYWLNMENAMNMVKAIAETAGEKDIKNSNIYLDRAAKLTDQLNELDEEFTNVAKNSQKTMVFGGRFAYYYFVNTYNVNYKTVYDTCSVNVEPSAKTVTEIVNFVKDNNIKYIYHEELSDPKTARSIAESTGASLLEFSTAHNVSKNDFENGVTFVDIMKTNLENLKKGLN